MASNKIVEEFTLFRSAVFAEIQVIEKSMQKIKDLMAAMEAKTSVEKKSPEDKNTNVNLRPHGKGISTINKSSSSSYAGALLFEQEERKFTVLGKMPGAPKVEQPKQIIVPVIKQSDSFQHKELLERLDFLNTGKIVDFTDSGIYPIRKTSSEDTARVLITPTSDPSETYNYFCLGLIEKLILDKSKYCTKFFPKNLNNTINHFITNVVKNEEQLVELQFNSTLPVWKTDGKMICPMHIIYMKTLNKIPKIMEVPANNQPEYLESFQVDRVISMQKLLHRLISQKVKVNYLTSSILVYSSSSKQKRKESEKIKDFLIQFEQNYLGSFPDELFKAIMEIREKSSHSNQKEKAVTPEDKDAFPPLEKAVKADTKVQTVPCDEGTTSEKKKEESSADTTSQTTTGTTGTTAHVKKVE